MGRTLRLVSLVFSFVPFVLKVYATDFALTTSHFALFSFFDDFRRMLLEKYASCTRQEANIWPFNNQLSP